MDSEGEASQLLQVPEQLARILSDNIHRLGDDRSSSELTA
jgi:hypothetical protein